MRACPDDAWRIGVARSLFIALLASAAAACTPLQWQEANGQPAPAWAIESCRREATQKTTTALTTYDRRGRSTTPAYVGAAETNLDVNECMRRKGYRLAESPRAR
jgi:hypothetical protein